MLDALYSIDKSVFYFINTALANPVSDLVMPVLTDWNKSWIGLSIVGVLWLLLVWKGGKKGRILGALLLILVVCTDQFSSQFIKPLFSRPRPCHVPLDDLRLLVHCGSGYSFPSTHAVNNGAFAFFMSYHYRKWTWVFASYGFLMCISRVVVGVHYPSDVFGGAVIGMAVAITIIWLQNYVSKRFPSLSVEMP